MMLTGRVYQADEGLAIGLSQYVVNEDEGVGKALELAQKVASNAAMTTYALMHILPRIVDSNQDQGLMIESLTSVTAQNAPEAKARLREFLDGKAKKAGQ